MTNDIRDYGDTFGTPDPLREDAAPVGHHRKHAATGNAASPSTAQCPILRERI
jgi:hypothetical protein